MSMDRKSSALHKFFVKRLWRRLNYEEFRLKLYQSIQEIRAGLANYFRLYNHQRSHQAVDYWAPAEIHTAFSHWLDAA